MNILVRYRSHFIIELEMFGSDGDLLNPNSSPIISFWFQKNRIRNNRGHKFYYEGGEIYPHLHKEELMAAKAAINEFLMNGTDVVYLNEYGVM